jgi:heme exporter protein A
VTQDAPIVLLAGVGVRVGSTTILRDVDLRICAGEIVGLYGANGAGKTTLLRVMATLLRPSDGSGTVFDADLSSSDRFDVRPRIGLIGHVPALYPELTLFENLRFAGRVAGLDEEAADRALAAVGLAAAGDRRAAASSHGMQRRAEFARELMMRRDLLLLDEPHSALDADAVDLVEALVHQVANRGGAVVLVSHDRDRVDAIADRSLVIGSGTVS